MLRLRKAIFGHADAPITSESWIHILRVGGSVCLRPHQNDRVRCVIVVHVDDLPIGGDAVVDGTILEVKREFDFGAW